MQLEARRKIYPEDTVLVLPSHKIAIVTRVCTEVDAEALAEFPDDLSLRFGPDRALTTGEIELLFVSGKREKEILQEDDVQLVDRHFVLGDMARRRDSNDSARCIVLNLTTEVTLEGVFSKRAVEGWVPATELVNAIQLSRGDHVTAQDWVGVVEEVLESIFVAGPGGQSGFSFFDMSSGMFNVGATSQEVMRDPIFASTGNWLPPDLQFDRVLANSPACIAVNWYALNQMVPVNQQDTRPRPRRFWSDLGALTLLRGAADSLHSVGDHMLFRTAADAIKRNAGTSQRADAQNAFIVTQSRTTIECLWQDGSRSSVSSSELEPCTPVDEEHDVSPGDLAYYQGEGDKRLVIAQSVNAEQRTVSVRFVDSSVIETVSALEIDPLGPSTGNSTVGVRRGDTVMLTASRSSDFPLVGRIGESELDYPAEEILRNQLSGFGMTQPERDLPLLAPIRRAAEAADVTWYAEVIDLLLDGQAVLRLPSGNKVICLQDHLVVFDDGFDPTLGWGAGMLDPEHDAMDASSEDGSWQTETDGRDEWAAEDTAEITLDSDTSKLEESAARSQSVSPMPESIANSTIEEVEGPWQRFAMLESAPSDHHFINEKTEPPSRSFSSRLQKEYKVLRSSLPDNILVQAYEDRIDLMRVLLIGTSQTPYEDAPFVFDFFLPPARYPNEAPLVHFHSWTGTQGRVSPNLYTEGKVCLSLLGTWSGEKTESWDPHRSSVFQILISLQGLVLVREPYFLEPGFEKQRGTTDGMAASALYSERTFVLSRSHIRRAVEQPPRGLEPALRHYYFAPGLNRLRVVVRQIKGCLGETMGSSEDAKNRHSPWQSRMTQGTAIPLRRILVALEKALNAEPP